MSNKIVPNIYRSVIDDVIANMRPAFDELGLSDEVLDELQHKWETKVIASRVAEFEPPPSLPLPSAHPHASASAHAYPGLPHYAAYVPPSAARAPHPPAPPIKPDPDARYAAYALPPLPGPPALSFPSLPGLYRLPQTDGPSASESEEEEDGYAAPRSAHPSLPLPPAKKDDDGDKDDEAINSDLDDSDTENEEDPEDAGPETDIVFCTYDKVARVKNKWKCVLKDGMIHTNGKDYLFQRCTGEFEW
ncbi:transcription factor IIA alpha/beta subunit [Mycena vulgaris]|nr:transcription factor IIA alpha/beta subunit [Mycena vulgaris]